MAEHDKLLPDWMIGLTDRIMKYYIDRELNVEPIILDRHPAPQEGHQYMMYAHIPFAIRCVLIALFTALFLKNTKLVSIL